MKKILGIDSQVDGRQVGALRPRDKDGSEIEIPVVQLRNGLGPTLLVTAGVHGDEYEGPIAVAHLAAELDWRRIKGRVLLVQTMNPGARDVACRTAPADGKDLNRCFPGNPEGTYADRIAAAVGDILVPQADAVIDLHTGGAGWTYIPSAMMHAQTDKIFHARTFDLMRSLHAPAGIVIDESDKVGMFDTFVEQRGIPFICCETGGALVTPDTVSVTRTIVENALIHMGIADGAPSVPKWRGERIAVLLESPTLDWQLVASVSGIFEPLKECGDVVASGEAIGLIHPFEPCSRKPTKIQATRTGYLFSRIATGRAVEGSVVAIVARLLD